MRPCWGKIPTSNMALKWRYQTRCKGGKRHEDELNTETWLTPQNSKRPHLKIDNSDKGYTYPLPRPLGTRMP